MANATRDLIKLALAPSESEREKAARTHTMIREHLETDLDLRKYRVDTFLQGSYKNSTNVRGDSDVDLGSLTTEIFYYDTSQLPNEAPATYGYGQRGRSLKEATEAEITPATFTFDDYRRDVLASLRRKYGANAVLDGNKAIKVLGNTSRLDADVLPCTAFRWYYPDWRNEATYHTGISFFTKQGERIVNFPVQHYENLKEKDQANSGKVKGSVRILKRIRTELEDAGEWDRKRSPSYYLEGLLCNVPDARFQGGYETAFPGLLQYLWQDLTEKKKSGDLSSYLQANNVFVLFHPKFWNLDDALAFIGRIWQALYG